MKNLQLLASILETFGLMFEDSKIESKTSGHTLKIFEDIGFDYSWIGKPEIYADNITECVEWFDRETSENFKAPHKLVYLKVRLWDIPGGSGEGELALKANRKMLIISGSVENDLYEFYQEFELPKTVEDTEKIADTFVTESYNFAKAIKLASV